MVTRVLLPKLTQTMDEGVLAQWVKAEGDRVRAGEILFVLDTDKVAVEVEAPADGVLRRILVREGERALVGALVALIGEPDEALPDVEASAAAAQTAPGTPGTPEAGVGPRESAQTSPGSSPETESQARPARAVPAARRLAQQHGLDLSEIAGSGPDGVITTEDVRRAVEDRDRAQGQRGELVPLSLTRRATAKRMIESAATIPQVTLHSEADLTEALVWKAARFPAAGERIGLTSILLRATALALRRHPELNARWTEDGVIRLAQINLGFAVATEEGLVVPVIHDADRRTVEGLARVVAEMTERARGQRLRLEDVRDATFTVTNLGMYPVRGFTPLINPPEVAILGVGRVTERPVAHAGLVVLRPVVDLSLTFDHRAVDGAPAAAFLESLVNLLASPDLKEAG